MNSHVNKLDRLREKIEGLYKEHDAAKEEDKVGVQARIDAAQKKMNKLKDQRGNPKQKLGPRGTQAHASLIMASSLPAACIIDSAICLFSPLNTSLCRVRFQVHETDQFGRLSVGICHP